MSALEPILWFRYLRIIHGRSGSRRISLSELSVSLMSVNPRSLIHWKGRHSTFEQLSPYPQISRCWNWRETWIYESIAGIFIFNNLRYSGFSGSCFGQAYQSLGLSRYHFLDRYVWEWRCLAELSKRGSARWRYSPNHCNYEASSYGVACTGLLFPISPSFRSYQDLWNCHLPWRS